MAYGDTVDGRAVYYYVRMWVHKGTLTTYCIALHGRAVMSVLCHEILPRNLRLKGRRRGGKKMNDPTMNSSILTSVLHPHTRVANSGSRVVCHVTLSDTWLKQAPAVINHTSFIRHCSRWKGLWRPDFHRSIFVCTLSLHTRMVAVQILIV